MFVPLILCILFVFVRTEPQISDELRLEEYYCQSNIKISDHLRHSKFVRLRGLTLPNDTNVPMDEFYEKAVARFVQHLPHVKYVSLSAEYEYSADDSTNGLELKQELQYIKQWMHTISGEFFKHRIQVLEFELFASFGFDDSIPLRQLVNETFGQDYQLDLEFCSLSFTCDIKVPLDFGSGEFLLSAELSDHLSRRVSGRSAQHRVSCERYEHEEDPGAHQLQMYELAADTLNLNAFQSKSTFYLDLPVVRNDRQQIHKLYKEIVRNFKRKLPKVERVKLRAQTYFVPKNSTNEAELKTELRYLKRWAQIVVDAFQQEDIQVQTFDLMATLGFEHTIPLTDLFNSAFNSHSSNQEAQIDSYLSRNLYNAIIPLDETNVKLQAELLLNGGLMNTKNASKKRLNPTKFFTLRQLLSTSPQ